MTVAEASDAALVQAIARSLSLPLPEPTLPGVILNARILADHAARVLAFELPDECPVATGFAP